MHTLNEETFNKALRLQFETLLTCGQRPTFGTWRTAVCLICRLCWDPCDVTVYRTWHTVEQAVEFKLDYNDGTDCTFDVPFPSFQET